MAQVKGKDESIIEPKQQKQFKIMNTQKKVIIWAIGSQDTTRMMCQLAMKLR